MGEDESPVDFFEQERLTTFKSSVFFILCTLLLGLPLWWHTTTVYRADLPATRVDDLLRQKPEILTPIILVFHENIPTETADQLVFLLEYELAIRASSPDYTLVFRYNVRRDGDSDDFSTNTEDSRRSQNKIVFELSTDVSVPKDKMFIAHVNAEEKSAHFLLRSVDVNAEALVTEVTKFVKEYFILEKELNTEYTSIFSRSDSLPGKEWKQDSEAGRISTSYDICFTLINSEPENYAVNWNIQSSIAKYLLPFLRNFDSIAKFKLTSQVIYQMRLGSDVKKHENLGFVFMEKDVPHLISPIERKIGFTMSNSSIINMVVYVPPNEESPLSFREKSGSLSKLAFYSSWGAVLIENLNKSSSTVPLNARPQIRAFIPVIKTLVGVRDLDSEVYRGVPSVNVSGLELDILHRQRTLRYIAQSLSTVNSLITLTEHVRNMVISDEIGGLTEDSLDHVQQSLEVLKSGSGLEKAVHFASLANLYAEKAFSDPSILEMLYFPEDQKYAIYVPMFVPMSLPLLSSVGIILGFWKSRKDGKLLE